jgi:hypothetical protein
MDENLWGLVSGSFEKFASDCALTYYDSESPEDCLSLTFLQLFQDSEIIYKELQASKKNSPVGLRFPDDSGSLVAAYAAIIAAIRSVRHSFLSSSCHFWDFSPSGSAKQLHRFFFDQCGTVLKKCNQKRYGSYFRINIQQL